MRHEPLTLTTVSEQEEVGIYADVDFREAEKRVRAFDPHALFWEDADGGLRVEFKNPAGRGARINHHQKDGPYRLNAQGTPGDAWMQAFRYIYLFHTIRYCVAGAHPFPISDHWFTTNAGDVCTKCVTLDPKET